MNAAVHALLAADRERAIAARPPAAAPRRRVARPRVRRPALAVRPARRNQACCA